MMRGTYALSRTVEEKIEIGACVWLVALVAAFGVVSFHWPMVGDVTFMHYVVFLMKHGMAPYRDIVDMNLPGSYLLEAAAMKLPGGDAVGWRIYDFLLLGMSSASLIAILRWRGWLAGILAAALFVLIHGQDGTVMAGERDLAAAALLLAGGASLLVGFRDGATLPGRNFLVFGCGLAIGCGACVKPTLFPAVVCALVWVGWQLRDQLTRLLWVSALLLSGVAVPVLATFVFLSRENSLVAFMSEIRGLLPEHASIDQRSLGYLLTHSFAPLLALLVVWLIAVYLLRSLPADPERWAIVLFALCGLFSYVVQGKGFSYQRYPFLAFLLPLVIGDFARLASTVSRKRLVGISGIALGIMLASQCLVRLTSFQRTPPAQPLLQDLSLFGKPEELSGHIQCMDTIGSCIDNLYAARIVQSTGFLYDCYLLGGRGSDQVTDDLRRHFWQEMAHAPPRLIVVTDSVCYEPARSFDKYARWPEFQSYLATNYDLAKQSGAQVPVHYWSRPQLPFGYRIYLRKPQQQAKLAR